MLQHTGAIAQLGERVVRNDEVRSSILLGSTKHSPEGARRRPEYLQKQGFRPFSLAGPDRSLAFQLVRQWGHILGHLPSAPKSDAPTLRSRDSARMKYRFNGKEKRLALGVYPKVSLQLARNRREDARRLLATGTDPGQQKKDAAAAKAGMDALTFGAIAREWMKGRIWAESYRVKVEAWMENDVLPWIGSRQAADLEAPDFLSIARRMERRGAIESGHRVIQNCGQIMRYAIASASRSETRWPTCAAPCSQSRSATTRQSPMPRTWRRCYAPYTRTPGVRSPAGPSPWRRWCSCAPGSCDRRSGRSSIWTPASG